MNRETADKLVRRLVNRIAPEADLDALDPRLDMREALDLDSMDMLRLATSVQEATGLEVPERDYIQLATFQGCVDYLTQRSAS